jgi:hypothetical protein
MNWKYNAGLLLIAAVVVIWVTSAEVTQVSTFSPPSSFLLVLFFGGFVLA